MNFKDEPKKEETTKNVKHLEDAEFMMLLKKLIRENRETLQRLAKK